MEHRATVPILVLNTLWLFATATGAHATSLGGGSLAAANTAKAVDHPTLLAAKWRHSSSAAILTCNKIFNRSERERCLGNMHHPHGVPPKR